MNLRRRDYKTNSLCNDQLQYLIIPNPIYTTAFLSLLYLFILYWINPLSPSVYSPTALKCLNPNNASSPKYGGRFSLPNLSRISCKFGYCDSLYCSFKFGFKFTNVSNNNFLFSINHLVFNNPIFCVNVCFDFIYSLH